MLAIHLPTFTPPGAVLRLAQAPAVFLLGLGGAVMLTALGAVVMPFDWMNLIHQRVGLGDLPHVPIVGYLTRSISALYALHGALLVFRSGSPVRAV